MPRSSAPAGDAHNFGRRVVVLRDRVLKPRTLLWEWLFLAAQSPLRRLLADASDEAGVGRKGFDFLPTLKFYPPSQSAPGAVERIALKPLGSSLGPSDASGLATLLGRSIALFSWFGVADLHWENLVLGRDSMGAMVFGPVDIEMLLGELSLPTETKLLPDADPEYERICRHACGVRRALPYLGKPVPAAHVMTMAAAYRETLALLDHHATDIARVLAELPELRTAPIRVCLRGTGDYVRARSEPLWPPLLDAEAEQLARGDIPYFFRLYGKRGIHYYTEPTLERHATLPLTGDVPKLEPLLSLARGLRSPARATLRNEGLFALLGAFDHPGLDGKHTTETLEVTFGARRIRVRTSGGEDLESRRNLGAFVKSVYLPCQCGEVRSVFVPRVTVCEARPGTL